MISDTLLPFTWTIKMISASISGLWPHLSHLSSHLILTKAPSVTVFLSSKTFSKYHFPIDPTGVSTPLLTLNSTNSCMYLTLQPNSFLPISYFLTHFCQDPWISHCLERFHFIYPY